MTSVLFCTELKSLFWTSGDICPDFQNQSSSLCSLSKYNLFIFRHYGDLGNVVVQGGKATVGNANQNAFVRLTGEDNVIGKSIVVRIPFTFKPNSHLAKTKSKAKKFRDVCRLFFFILYCLFFDLFHFRLLFRLGLNMSLHASHLNEIN